MPGVRGLGRSGVGAVRGLGGLGAGPIDDIVAQLKAQYLPEIEAQVRAEAEDAVRPWVLGAMGLSLLAIFLSMRNQRA